MRKVPAELQIKAYELQAPKVMGEIAQNFLCKNWTSASSVYSLRGLLGQLVSGFKISAGLSNIHGSMHRSLDKFYLYEITE